MQPQSVPALPVLLISHYTGRTGAPLVLLHLINWLKQHTGLRLHVLIRSRGELQADFAAVADVIHVPRLPRLLAALLRRTGGQRVLEAIEDVLLRRRIRRLQLALVYSNTITNTRELLALGPLGIPTLCHVHEMEYWICHELGLARAAGTIPFIHRYVAVSTAVSEFLVAGLAVPREQIEVIHGFPFSTSGIPADASQQRQAARRELSIPDATFVVGACGTVDWRKGPDLFLAVARAVTSVSPHRSFRFIWIGGPVAGAFFDQLQYDLSRAGLADLVSFVGPCRSPSKYYAAMDAYLLTSREDPFPLVMLEAATYGLPLLGFEGSGGVTEFVATDAGIVVPYLDIRKMANVLLDLIQSPDMRKRHGIAAMERVRLHHNPDTQCAALFAAMTRTQPRLANSLRS